MSERLELQIYDGRQCIGSIVESRPSRFDAIDATGKCLGVFPSASAASDAIFAARRKASGHV